MYREEIEDVVVDTSREAQIRDVECTFPPTNKKVDLASIHHPNHSGKRAVDYYDLFPDPETFATAFDVFRFSERPGDRATDQEDPRLDSALLRPVRLEDGETFMAYYLTSEDEQAIQLKQERNFALEMNTMTNDEVRESPLRILIH
jgi:RNA polymerase II-associated factor 1